MKKVKANKAARRRSGGDEILPEYDFSRARPNKYASRYAKGSIVITLDPDVAAVFPGAREANGVQVGHVLRQDRLRSRQIRHQARVEVEDEPACLQLLAGGRGHEHER